jgi:flagellar biosynthetic protein FliR
MEILNQYIPNFFFILIRAGIVLSFLPFFSSKTFPPQFRIGLIVAVAFILTPVVEFHVARASIPVVVLREVLFGIVIGGAVRAVFYAVDMAGQLMASASGMSMAATFSPDVPPSTEVSRLYGIIAMLIFLAMDAHHDIIAILVRSYELFAPGQFEINRMIVSRLFSGSGLFVLALQLSAPIVIIMLITNVVLGFIYKATPQMNVFFVGYPVYLFLALLTMLISLPVFAAVMSRHFTGMQDEIGRVMLLIKG